MSLGLKIKQIRKSLGLSQRKFAALVGISLGMIKKYETQINEIGSAPLQKILTTPECFQFTLWLLTDQTAPFSGQISPGDRQPDHDQSSADEQYREAFIAHSNKALKSMTELGWLTTRKNIKHRDVSDILFKELQPITTSIMANPTDSKGSK